MALHALQPNGRTRPRESEKKRLSLWSSVERMSLKDDPQALLGSVRFKYTPPIQRHLFNLVRASPPPTVQVCVLSEFLKHVATRDK